MQVESGRFASAVDVLEAGVDRLQDEQQTDLEIDEGEMREIETSEAEIAEGRALDFKKMSAELRHEFLSK